MLPIIAREHAAAAAANAIAAATNAAALADTSDAMISEYTATAAADATGAGGDGGGGAAKHSTAATNTVVVDTTADTVANRAVNDGDGFGSAPPKNKLESWSHVQPQPPDAAADYPMLVDNSVVDNAIGAAAARDYRDY